MTNTENRYGQIAIKKLSDCLHQQVTVTFNYEPEFPRVCIHVKMSVIIQFQNNYMPMEFQITSKYMKTKAQHTYLHNLDDR